MPTRDEMNSCGVPFLALRRPEVIEADGELQIRDAAIGILQSELARAMDEMRALEVAKRDAETRAGEWEMIAKLKGVQVDVHRASVLALSEDRERLKVQIDEQRRISKRLAGENERLRAQVAMMAEVEGPAACLGSAVQAWQAAIEAEVASVGGMMASMERVDVLGVKWDEAEPGTDRNGLLVVKWGGPSEEATEARTASEASPAPSPQKIDFASHAPTSQASRHVSGCTRLGCSGECGL